MGKYRSTANHNGMRQGEVVEIDPDEIDRWEGEIDRGLLEEVDDHDAGPGEALDAFPPRVGQGTRSIPPVELAPTDDGSAYSEPASTPPGSK